MCEETLTAANGRIFKSGKQENMEKEPQVSLDQLGIAYDCQSNAGRIK